MSETLIWDLVTWLCCIDLASLGSDTIVPAGVGVLDETSQIMEELREGHVASLVDSVIEQGGTPQCGVFPEQDTMDAGQALLCWVQRLQVVLLSAHTATPRLVTVVDATEIMCAWWTETRTIYIDIFICSNTN